MKEIFNPELNKKELYKDIYEDNIVNVKDEKVLVHEHFLRDKDGEDWVDFNNPNENLHAAFNAYRDKKGFLSPQAIKKIRESYGLSLREFANVLGMGYGTLSSIENNKRLQTKQQNALFVLSMHADSFKDLIFSEKDTKLNENMTLVNTLSKMSCLNLL